MRIKFTIAVLLLCLGVRTNVWATALAPFIDLQEAGLTVVTDGEGLLLWDHTTPATLNVNVGGTVRFALLYWAGRERPCTFDGTTCTFSQPFKDQEMIFNGTPLTGTVIGTESQPVSAGGPILNIGYFADVTSLVSAAGPGNHTFTFNDGNLASNLWRLDGVSLFVAYTNAADPTFYRVLVWDNLDFAFGDDPTPGDNRVTSPVTFGHGATTSARTAQLFLIAGDAEASRPDHVTISNNPTLFNTLDASAGPSWDNDQFTINIPANVDTTVVQAHSAPAGQNPDSLLWQMAALRVALPSQVQDATAPVCRTTLVAGPPAQAITTIRDTGSGVFSIVVTMSQNADTVVPPFIPGTTDPIVITSTKIDQTQRARIEVRVTDGAGNVSICDPIVALVARSSSKPETHVFTDVPTAEGFITLVNGNPGMRRIDIRVNDQRWSTPLRPGETMTIDARGAMRPGDHNSIEIVASGQKGASVTVFVWDGNQ